MMEDIPNPATESYSVGDRVEIYLGKDDLDSRFHGLVCIVVDVTEDNLSAETGRELDAYSYTLKDAQTGEVLGVSFRHRDLVPAENSE